MTTVQLIQRRGQLVERYARLIKQNHPVLARLLWAELHNVTTKIIKRELRNERKGKI